MMPKKRNVLTPKKTFDQSNSHGKKGLEGSCDPLHRNNPTIENLHKIIMPKCENYAKVEFHLKCTGRL